MTRASELRQPAAAPDHAPEQPQEYPPRTDMLLALRFRAYKRICWDGRNKDRQAAMHMFREADRMLAWGETDMREAAEDSKGSRYPSRDSMLLDIRCRACKYALLYRRSKDRSGAVGIFRQADDMLRTKPRNPHPEPEEPQP